MSRFNNRNKPNLNGEVVEGAIISDDTKNKKEPNWFRKNLQTLSVAAFAVTAIVSVAHNPKEVFDDAKFELLHDGWYVGSSFVATEGMFVGGVWMMLTASGQKMKWNPLKIGSQFTNAKNSPEGTDRYKHGLAINTIGALGTAGVAIGATVSSLPREAWAGAITWATFDIVSTAVSRTGMYAAIPHVTEFSDNAPVGEIDHGQ